MFDACYLRLGQGRFASCTPLTVSLVSSLYALPACDEPQLRAAVEASGAGQPWADSLAVAPDQTITAIGAMLRQVMLATRHLESAQIDTSGLPEGSRARLHLEALHDLWAAHLEILPADLRSLKHFLACEPSDALQPFFLVWSRDNLNLRPLEIAVLEKLERSSGHVGEDDPDVARLISARAIAAAPQTVLAGHIQRNLLEPAVSRLPADDSVALLSVRDSLTECEATVAIIQRWLAEDEQLVPSDIGIMIPNAGDYAAYLGDVLASSGLHASSLPSAPALRSIGAEAVLHFVQCRRRPAPAMALASLYCSPVMSWAATVGNLLARRVMEGDFAPTIAETLDDRAAALFTLIRSASPASNAQFKEQLRRFSQLLNSDEALRPAIQEARAQIGRLVSAAGSAPDAAEPDWEKLIPIAANYQASATERGPYYLGGVAVMLGHEAPTRRFRKLIVLGFNDGAYPTAPAGNPFFLDSEVALISEKVGIVLPSQASQLEAALTLFKGQIGVASEQLIILLAERDRLGSAVSPSSTLPLLARLVAGCEDPEDMVLPMTRGEGSIWDRLIAWQPAIEFKSPEQMPIPVHFELGFDLLAIRKKDDGTPRPQSPSRLEKLLVSPLAWLLGELGASHLSWQPETLDIMLRGSLAHEVFERLFQPGTDFPDDAAIKARVPEILMDRIRQQAPFLQSATWMVERSALEAEIIKAARHWSMVLRSLGAEVVGNEFWLNGALFEHPVHGKADCLLRLPNGQPIVVDYKKSSSGTRRQRLQKGWDLQVDLYRQMEVRTDEQSNDRVKQIALTLSSWNRAAAVAYHTLNDGNVLLNGADELDNEHIEGIPGEIAANAMALIKTRFEALRAGHLETNTAGDEKFFTKSASLGTYALEDSPLVTAFMRDDASPSVTVGDADND